MPSMILLPDATSGFTTHWVDYPATTHHDALDDDNGDTSYIRTTSNGRYITLGYANPSVAEANIESIHSVQFLSSGKAIHRTDPSLVRIEYEVQSGNPNEQVSYDAHRTNYETINGTARPYSDGSSAAWTYANLESLIMNCTKDGTVEVYLSYLALEVTYTAAVSADNATFFGANF